jgi:hypothetical protein
MSSRLHGHRGGFWGGKNGTCVLPAEEKTPEYSLYKDTGTSKVDDDIALL